MKELLRLAWNALMLRHEAFVDHLINWDYVAELLQKA